MIRSSSNADARERVLFEDEMPTDVGMPAPWDFRGCDSSPFEDEMPTGRLAPGHLGARDVRRSDRGIFEDEMPTNRLESVDLDDIETRVLKRPARWSGLPYRPAIRRVPRPAMVAAMELTPSPASLDKRSPVLVLPEDTPTGRMVARAVMARVSADDAVRAAWGAKAVVLERPPTQRRGGGRHALRLALLGLVLCWQPAWWNVGDLNGRHAGVVRVLPRTHTGEAIGAVLRMATSSLERVRSVFRP
jgi:hypothetical protein